jgi:hypothetical protein
MVLLHFRDLVIILCTLHTGLEIYPQGLQEEVVTPGMMAIPTLAGARSRRITYLPLL